MAITANLYIDQGSDFIADMELTNDDGSSMNLTGFTAYSQFRSNYNSLTAYSFITSIPDPVNGKLRLTLPGTTSTTIKPSRYLYDVEITNGTNKIRVVEGMVILNAEITKIP